MSRRSSFTMKKHQQHRKSNLMNWTPYNPEPRAVLHRIVTSSHFNHLAFRSPNTINLRASTTAGRNRSLFLPKHFFRLPITQKFGRTITLEKKHRPAPSWPRREAGELRFKQFATRKVRNDLKDVGPFRSHVQGATQTFVRNTT